MSKNPRPWPVLVISNGGVIHISRANGDRIGKVHTECGRCIEHSGNLRATGREIMDTDGKTIVRHKIWTYKFCSRCGSQQDFADAANEFNKATKERREKEDERRERVKESVGKMKCATRSLIKATCLPEGAEGIENDNWGVKFDLDGKPFIISPTPEECERLHKAAEDAACHSG